MDLRVVYVVLAAIILISLLSYFKFKKKIVKFLCAFIMSISIIAGCLLS